MISTANKRYSLAFIVIMAMLLGALQASGQDAGGKPASVTAMDFKYDASQSRFEITFDKAVSFEKNVSEADKQVILDIKNAKISKKQKRFFDTSSYKTNVSMITPYQSGDRVRVTFQLLDNGGVEFSQDGKKIVATIDNKQGDQKKEDPAKTLSDAEKQPDAPDAAKTDAADASTPPPPAAETPAPVAAASTSPAEKTSNDQLDGFFESQRSKNYVGKRIYLQVRDTELADVFRIISEASEFNIVVSDAVKGKVLMNLTDVPWDQALDLILKSYRLAAERQGNVLRVTTIDALTKEKEAEAAAKRASESAEPLVVKIFPISYAKISDLQNILKDFLTKDAAAAAGIAPGAAASTLPLRGSIQVDNRTNSLIVRETPSAMEKIKRIIKELDTQTPQILIEAKFVSVAEQSSKTVDGRIFTTTRELNGGGTFTTVNTKNNFSSVFGGQSATSVATQTGFAVTAPQGGGASFGFMPKAGLLPGLSEIGAFIDILESESQAKVIASPRVVTANKEAATITQGTNVTIAVAAAVPGGVGTFKDIALTLTLTVTPQVTNDGSVIMNINFSQTIPGPALAGATFSTDTKSVNTNVLVDSGATLVIGGIYQSNFTNQEAGIPVLRDLPILGPFFGTKAKATSKNELFIFLSPRVINEKEAGIKG